MAKSTGSKDVIQIYLKDIGSIPLLSREEEEVLSHKVKDGDDEARKTLIHSNLRLVVSIAKRYTKLGLSLLDLIEEGNIGLMKSIDKYDPAKGCRVGTYASWWIKQAIMRALANQGKTIRIPVYMLEKISAVNKAIASLTQQNSRPPTDEEIIKATGLDVEKIHEIKRISQHPTSLYTTINEDGMTELIDTIANKDAILPSKHASSTFIKDDIMSFLDKLSEREEKILIMYFGLFDKRSYTLEEIGTQFGITRERVRQIKERAIEKIKTLQDEQNRNFDDYHYQDDRM